MSVTMQTPQRPLPGAFAATPAIRYPGGASSRAPAPAQADPAPAPSVPEISAIERGARTINDTLAQEKSAYPELDVQIGQGVSSDYCMAMTGGGPFQRVKIYPIPEQVLGQFNKAQVTTLMGLFADLEHAWVTVDNCLYLWDYTSPNPKLIGFEDQPHGITAVKVVKPRPGVFVPSVTRVIVIATFVEIILLGVSVGTKETGERQLTLYQTGMSAAIRGLTITCIEGDDKTGRIFFSGSGDNDVYELYYQQDEKWFYSRCWKINHTSSRLAVLAPNIPLSMFSFSNKEQPERVVQMVVDSSRSLLYTLSNKSTIRAFHLKANNALELVITRPLTETLRNITHMVQSDLLPTNLTILSIQAISGHESNRLHLIATTSTGCRLFISATSSTYYHTGGPPSSMQLQHIRFPPSLDADAQSSEQSIAAAAVVTNSRSLVPTDTSSRFAPGYFFAAVMKDERGDDHELFVSAPDSGRIIRKTDAQQPIRHIENGMRFKLSGVVQDIALVTPPFAASSTPVGFGNELAVQFDQEVAEVAVLTNSGVYTFRRQRLVDNFAMAMRVRNATEGFEEAIKSFIRLYGRIETASSALAVSCGQGLDVASDHRAASISDNDITTWGRTAFIEYGGRPSLNENTVIDQSTPHIDLARPSPRHDGLALYISRLIRSIWKSTISTSKTSPEKGYEIWATIGADKLLSVQKDLVQLQEWLNKNKSLIEGLAGPEALGKVSTKSDEISLQAEHRALHALVTLLSNMIEGIAFVQMLFNEKIVEIYHTLEPESQEKFKSLTYEELFCSADGRALAKELVRAIVNRNIAHGANVDTVADSLRRRCGTFCSAADVVIFKAQEQLKRANEAGSSTEFGRNLLNESLRLFSQVVDSLTFSQLESAVDQFIAMQFYAGAIQLSLKSAQEKDRGNRALTWIQDGRPENDPAEALFNERGYCYDLIHRVIAATDEIAANPSNSKDPGMESRLRADVQRVIEDSDDEVFQTDLYDWYLANGQSNKLLELHSPFVANYLMRRAPDEIAIANLLWRYYAQIGRPFEAARVQLDLAKSEFKLSLEQRIEYLSRAKANASTYSTGPGRSSRQKLLREITEFLDAASIQDDILEKLKDDTRLSGERRDEVLAQVDGPILSLNELFVQYADNAGYYDICILIYQAADHRRPSDIRETWKNLLGAAHEKAVELGTAQPWESVADAVRNLGTKLDLAEATFPVNELLPMLKRYAFEHQRGVGPDTWVVDLFIDLGITCEQVFGVLQNMLYMDEVPFSGRNREFLAGDILHAAQKWLRGTRGSDPFGNDANANEVLATLEFVQSNSLLTRERLDLCQDLRAKINQLLR